MPNYKFAYGFALLSLLSGCDEPTPPVTELAQNKGLFSLAEQNSESLNQHHELTIKVLSIKHLLDEKGFAPRLFSNLKLSTSSPQWPYIWCRINLTYHIGKKEWKISKMVYFNNGEATLENTLELNRFGIKVKDVKLELSSDGWVPAFPATFDVTEETSVIPAPAK
jgi:hypothetical protein